MMSKMTLSIAMLMSLLLVALPAAAEHRTHDKREPKLEKVAHKLAVATSELYAEARHGRPHHRWAVHRALFSLRDLERHASAFHQRVERHGVSAYETQREYRRLSRAHAAARYRVERLRRGDRLHDELARVDRLMAKLDTKLARLDTSRRQSRRHARHERRSDHWSAVFAWNF
jgi:hypothetical protein